ncbi:TlyA family rRNA (cytidine-2'-O)-methyltransferase [Bowdeniella nasicola]|uniref:TlyA family rRNA (Cytidine-2'-O)-methyltransferase n=1 Tax=Bowdeniella nasicola TaxID=208480 RepID=A0A1Q5Q550_9ACTO|nr:TlyA family RNA methyltransferase [Bowdeniella nasicola]OKL54819.1 TlyA family rRNA (cytidine-2'-O)-methyltransferase [Bowdeniella nasicola]
MAKLARIDAELVRRNLATSRTHARDLIEAGRVTLDGTKVDKVARQVNPAQAIEVIEAAGERWASRGAHKLLGALEYLGDDAPVIEGVRALDAGASTGGFTDVLLRRGAASVVAVDVGYGQLDWRLQSDDRVEVHDRTNVRHLEAADIAPAPSLVVADLSFISLTLVIPALARSVASDAMYLLMVKPQFEIGKDRLPKGAVVRDPEMHYETVAAVAASSLDAGLRLWAVAPSPLPGPAGNVEYFIALAGPKVHPPRPALTGDDLAAAIRAAIADGPAGRSAP